LKDRKDLLGLLDSEEWEGVQETREVLEKPVLRVWKAIEDLGE
jgi:hypothetical protein